MKSDDLLPNIDEYLENVDTVRSVSSKGLEELVFKVRAKTGLDIEVCEAIVAGFFQEIRNTILRGDIVKINGLGRFFVAGPCSGNKERVFPKFITSKTLKKAMNDPKY